MANGTLLNQLLDEVDLPSAGRCVARMPSAGRIYPTFHGEAPQGWSRCSVCRRLVVRGRGRWWTERDSVTSVDHCVLCGGQGMITAPCAKCGKQANPPNPCRHCGRTSHGMACSGLQSQP